jgi:hypothetical protein
LWATLTPHPREYYLQHIFVDNPTGIHASADFEPCGIIMFEVTNIDHVDDTKYDLAQRWEIGGEYPFSLFLKPFYALKNVN